MEKIPVLVVAGPTASGKTALAVELARQCNGEVVSADSMQIYKRMNIGTAKPTAEEMKGVPHYMIDILEPWENFSVADYVEKAHEIISDINSRHKLSIVCGGTGLYIDSLVNDVEFSKELKSDDFKEKLVAIARKEGAGKLFEMLKERDPKSAENIHPNNVKRIIRAIEFFEYNGKPISEHNEESRKRESRYSPLMLMINPEREILYERIEKRVDIMLEKGLIDEVKDLADMGLGKHNISMQGIGYKEVLDYLRGLSLEDEMIRIIKRDSRHYAKRQFTWFNRDKRMIKIDGDLVSDSMDLIKKWRKQGE